MAVIAPSASPAPTAPALPFPRTPLPHPAPSPDGVARWYENELGWATVDGPPVQLLTGLRFDVLELPADAGLILLRRYARTGPVALAGRRVRLLVAAGSADELPGLLDWLEWSGIDLELTAIGRGERISAPQGAADWLRPPEPGGEVEPSLPALAPVGRPTGSGGVPDLVRLVSTAATACHRARLLRTAAAAAIATAAVRTNGNRKKCDTRSTRNQRENQPLAFS
ncbi:SCO3374 family protein [Streptomyces sp. SCSIO 30461]|uniref:SCO3374 family protein n=1 Tax=Streptomyces sp. SCSIO 30461 TaxID=3118085 RepID=UPI0030D5305E